MTSEFDKINLRSAFFDNAEIHFMLFDKELNIIDVNESLVKHYHVSKEFLIGKSMLEISPNAKEIGLYDKYKEVIRTGKSAVIEDIRTNPIYGNRYIRIKAFKVGDGLGVTASNITELRNTIEALEVFCYNAFHDIQAPIASILGITDLAIQDDLRKNGIDYSWLIKEQAERLESTIQQTIATLKVWRNQSAIQEIDFNEVIRDVKKSITFVNGFDRIIFKEEVLLSGKFFGDKLLLTSLFQNLIDNSIKYSDPNKEFSYVKIKLTEEEAFVKIVVEDNGIGIDETLQKDIFKMFFRATDQASGTGLGLYTVRHGIEKCGGHIKFESKRNEGTIFTVFIPNASEEKKDKLNKAM